MEQVGPPLAHHLNAVIGWIELGALQEAEREFTLIPRQFRHHPDTSLAEWELAAAARDWRRAINAARTAIQLAPERSDGWIKLAFALHEVRLTQEAHETLTHIIGNFPTISIIPYNLECYAAQLGKLEEALSWINEAVKLGGIKEILKMARSDEDLRPLWPQLEKIKFE